MERRKQFGTVPLPENLEDMSQRAWVAWTNLCTFARWNRGRTVGDSCWPSLKTLAKRAKFSVTYIRGGLAELEKAGLIHKEYRHREDGRSIAGINYTLYPYPSERGSYSQDITQISTDLSTESTQISTVPPRCYPGTNFPIETDEYGDPWDCPF